MNSASYIQPRTAAKPRIEWMDAVRGLAIFLVVFDHALYFAIENADNVPRVMVLISESLNPIRMPAMVFLSGMLLSGSLSKGAATYLDGKVRRILYPYVVWSVIYITIWLLANPWTDTHHSPVEYLGIIYDPPGHLWFLHNLFLFYVLALVFRSVPRLLLVAVALVVSAVVGPFSVDTQRFFFLFAFFIFGNWTVVEADTWTRIRTSLPALGLSALLTVALVPAAFYLGNTRYELTSVPLVLGALIIMTGLGQLLCRTWLSGPLRFMGRNSLNLYVMHWIIISVVVTALGLVAAPTGVVTLLIGLAAGLGGSIIGTLIIQRLNLHWLMALPPGIGPKPQPRPPVAPRRQEG